MFDMHSHILFGVDDGAQKLTDSVALLKVMKSEGITDVMLTPHFYPQDTDIDEFLRIVYRNFAILKNITEKYNLPKIYLGCELLYFGGLGQSESLSKLCLNNSNYLLLELTDNIINDKLFSDLSALMNQSGIIPVIAHIERYCKAKNYKKLINFIVSNNLPVQVNASSFLVRFFRRPIKMLIKQNIPIILGTDSHSVDTRPPRMLEALKYIEKKYGAEYMKQLLKTSEIMKKKIIG